MNRRAFIKTTALAAPVGLISREATAFAELPLIIAGGIIVGIGAYMGYQVYQVYKRHFPDDPAPAPVPTQGAANPPTMPPKTNAPPVVRPKSMTMLNGGNIVGQDISGWVLDAQQVAPYSIVLPDLSPVIYWCQFDFQSTTDDMATWQHETTLEVWASQSSAVLKHDRGVEWSNNRKDIWLDLRGGDRKKLFRMWQAA